MIEWRDPFGNPGYLSPKDIQRAFGELPQRSAVAQEELEVRLQTAALWYANLKQARKTSPVQPTSVAERKWNDIVREVARVKTDFETMHQDQRRFADFCGAAHELATPRFGVIPPHVEPETVGVPPLPDDGAGGELDIWPIDKAFAEAIRSLDWLAKVSEWAGIRAAADKQKAGAPSPDKAAHKFVRSLASIFKDATGLDPDEPRHDNVQDQWSGSFLDFAEIAFAPVDPRRTRSAIAGLIRRAVKFPKKNKGWPRRSRRDRT